jgi:signal transduction histidine kinase
MTGEGEPKVRLPRNAFLWSGFVIALLILGSLEWIGLRQEAKMMESTVWIAQTHDMESELNRMLALVDDIESGVRGYILTGNSAFLAPYETARIKIPDQQRLLMSLITDPKQKELAIALGTLIEKRMDISRRNIELRKNAGLKLTSQAIRGGEGKAVMDQIRALHAQMVDWNNTLLKLRSSQMDSQVILSNQIRILGTILSMVLMGAIFMLMIRENKLRQHSVHALAESENEAKKANHAKTEFLSRMSHELRTPLNSILGFTQLIQQQQDNLTDDQKNAILLVTQSGQHLQQLINEALDIAHIESGKIFLHQEPVPVNEIIQECLTLLESGARMQDIKLQVKGQTDCMIITDRFRFKQVLINLISNAIKYNRAGGSVTVECCPTNHHLRLNVIDTGIGIPEDKEAEVFTPFTRFAMEKCEGTGMGLTITKLLVEAMDGKIGFNNNNPAPGCTFWIEFLRERRSIQRSTDVNHLPSENVVQIDPTWSTITGKILYVEDTSANVQLLRMVLKRYLPGVILLDSGSGEHGIELAKKEQPNLILMDISLPGISGIEAFKILKNEPETCAIPVIAMSATAMQRDIDRAMEAGFNSYITKPFDIRKIPGIIVRYVSAGM